MGPVPTMGPDPAAEAMRLEAENAALREQLEATEHYTALTLTRATRLSQVVSVLGIDADVDQVVERAAVTVTELFSADMALLLLGDDTRLEVVGHWGLRAGDVPGEPFAIDHLGALTPARPVVVGPAPELGLPAWMERYRGRHAAWARLLVGEEPLGLMLIVRRGDFPFEGSDATELQAVASRLALAVENGLLHRRMAAQLAQLSRMHRFTVELAGTLDLRAVAQLVVETVLREADVGLDAVLTQGPDPAGDVIASSAGALPQPSWARMAIQTASGVIGHLVVPELPEKGSDADDRLWHLLGLSGLALEKAILYERSREQARHDSLTGLLSHRTFHEALAGLEHDGEPFSLVVVDIDDFKQINDLYGHPTGDDALREVAGTLASTVRSGDAVYRTGGEEFCVLLPGLAPEHAHGSAERMRRAVARISTPMPVTISVGVASYPADATDRGTLVEQADAALYASKHAGKNRTTLASQSASPAATTPQRGLDLRALHDRDAETAVHSAHVMNLAVATARELGLEDERLGALRTAAKLHDIGKVGVPSAILTKPGRLTPEELVVVRTHPIVGAELLRSQGQDDAARFVLEHHEDVDGTGYPAGLRGERIALESRIIRVVDSYVAMILDRPYRAAMAPEAAVEELRRCAGTDYDPRVVAALERALV